jgi:hypothetical protein
MQTPFQKHRFSSADATVPRVSQDRASKNDKDDSVEPDRNFQKDAPFTQARIRKFYKNRTVIRVNPAKSNLIKPNRTSILDLLQKDHPVWQPAP